MDGNVTIDTDFFNTSGKKVAIILLKSDTNNSKGNLLIKPNVRYLSSLVYTDGSIESVDSTGNSFIAMDKNRSDMLSKQLILK